MLEAFVMKKLKGINDLPPLPEILFEIYSKLDSITSSAQQLADIIKKDPALTTKLLKLANSPYYGLIKKVNSVTKAIVILGFNEVRNIVIALSVTGTFPKDMAIGPFSSKDLWIHSIGVAYSAQKIGEIIGQDIDISELFTIGLIHDIGRFLLPVYFQDSLVKALSIMDERKMSLIDAEAMVGIVHTEIGAFLATWWKLSDLIINAIRYHHTPKRAGDHELIASIIYVSDQLVQKLCKGWDLDYKSNKLIVPKCLSLTTKDLKITVSHLKNELRNALQQWKDII